MQARVFYARLLHMSIDWMPVCSICLLIGWRYVFFHSSDYFILIPLMIHIFWESGTYFFSRWTYIFVLDFNLIPFERKYLHLSKQSINRYGKKWARIVLFVSVCVCECVCVEYLLKRLIHSSSLIPWTYVFFSLIQKDQLLGSCCFICLWVS